MDDCSVWPYDAHDDYLMRNPAPIRPLSFSAARDWQAEFDAIRNAPVADSPDYDGPTQGVIAEALLDKGYRWVAARSMAASLGARIPPGAGEACAAWITEHVQEIR